MCGLDLFIFIVLLLPPLLSYCHLPRPLPLAPHQETCDTGWMSMGGESAGRRQQQGLDDDVWH